ncbi:MAG: putative toxin-antitoxin system toxin component, PIN family [Candidatus Saccharibacteria bacterium]|nr:putative toxin-antitoxin system toxin component, PIN family [Candidatus Saccharibacteria bacterium]
MHCKAVIDTNVVVSSLLSKGKRTAVTDFIDMMLNGDILPVASKEIFNEYEEVLRRPKFNFSKNMVDDLIDFLRQNSIMADTWDTGMEFVDKSDLPFFEAYIAEQSPETFLVTGNIKHYPEWPYIVTPKEMLSFLG